MLEVVIKILSLQCVRVENTWMRTQLEALRPVTSHENAAYSYRKTLKKILNFMWVIVVLLPNVSHNVGFTWLGLLFQVKMNKYI